MNIRRKLLKVGYGMAITAFVAILATVGVVGQAKAEGLPGSPQLRGTSYQADNYIDVGGGEYVGYLFNDYGSYYSVETRNVAVNIYDYYTVVYDAAFENVVVYNERWDVEYQRPNLTFASTSFYGSQRSYEVVSDDEIVIYRTGNSVIGQRVEVYTFKAGQPGKVEIRQTCNNDEVIRYQWLLSGIVADSESAKTGITLPTTTGTTYKDSLGDMVFEVDWEGELINNPGLTVDNLIEEHAQGRKATTTFGEVTVAAGGTAILDPTYRSYGTGDDAGTSFTVTKPSGLTVGDLMVAHVGAYGYYSDLAYDTPSGWTKVRQDQNWSGSIRMISAIFWKIATSGDVAASNFTFTIPDGGDLIGAITAFQTGTFDSVTPINANNGGNGSASSISVSGITPSVANCTLLHLGANGNAGVSAYAITTSDPAGWTELYDWYYVSDNLINLAMAYDDRAETTATGSATATQASGEPYAWSIIAIAPVALSAPTLDTNAATSVEETTATLDGDIDAINGDNADNRGFVWGTTTQGDPGDTAPGSTSYDSYWSESGSFGVGNFTHAITSLTQGELYYVRACADNSEGWAYGDEIKFLTKPEDPTSLVATPGDTEITLDWTKGTGADNTYIRGEASSYPTDRNDGYLVYNSTGVTIDDTGLSNGTPYYYRAWSYATEGGEEQYSDSYDQDTATPAVATVVPTLDTNDATSVEETTATLDGDIDATGGENADYRGFVWDTQTRGDPGDVTPASTAYTDYWTENGSYGVANFTHGLTSLTQGELYYVRAVAHNSAGWAYGDEITFLTKPEDPTSLVATPGDTEITLDWTKGTGAQNTYIRGQASSYPADRAGGYLVYNSTGLTIDDTGLSNGTPYYYRAWSYATEGGKEQYSDGYDEATTTPSATPIAPTITNSTGVSLIEDTTARLNGNLTDDGSASTTVTVYWGDNDGVTTPGNWDYNTSLGTQSEGALYYDASSLLTGTTTYYRYYASNSEGNDWANTTESFLTKPAAPTGVAATDGSDTTKVVVTWTGSTGATGYKVYEGANLLDTLGDVGTYDDTAAAAPTITAGNAVASDGTTSLHVALTLSGTSANAGASRTYKVVALNATGDSDASGTNAGYRGVGALSYQWQRSAGDSDATYSNIIGGVTAAYNDTGAPSNGDGRFFQCVLDATGASQQTSASNRGYRSPFVPATVTTNEVLGFGGNWAIVKGTITDEGDAAATEVGFDYGLTTGYGSEETVIGTYNTGDSFIVILQGLSKGTMYHYRAKVDNGAVSYGADALLSTEGSAVVYEYHNTGGDGASDDIYGNNWGGQSFTVGSISHTITKIRVAIQRTGSPGTITVSLKHANESYLPTGNDLVSGTLDGDLIDTAYAWYTIEVDEYTLEAGEGYAIAIRAVAGDNSNDVQWSSDTGGGEANGTASDSTDGGISWVTEAPADYLFEIYGNPAIDVQGGAVFPDYIEDGDMLFLVDYKNVYAPYYPYEDPSIYFYLQLLDTDGVTVLAQVPCRQWGYKPGSIYLNADSAAGLTAGSAYYVGLYGNFSGNPVSIYQLQDEDWLGQADAYLKQWVIGVAAAMEDYYSELLDTTVVLTTSVAGKGQVLNEEGGVVFAIGIERLPEILPDVFQTAVRVPTHIDYEFTDVFSTVETWEGMVGAEAVEQATAWSVFTGIDAKTIIGMLILLFYLVVASVMLAKGNAMAGVALAFPFVGAAAYLRVIDVQLLIVPAAIMTLLIIRKFWWTST